MGGQRLGPRRTEVDHARTFIVSRDGRIDLLMNRPHSDVLRAKRQGRGTDQDPKPVTRTVGYTRRDPLTVRTGRLTFKADANSLDVTRKSGGPIGSLFAPSWETLNKALAVRKVAAELKDATAMVEHWPKYVEAYTLEMRRSYAENRAVWLEVLARPSVVLRCYCHAGSDADGVLRCHRVLLAGMLVKLGAKYEGEVS